MSNLFTRLGIAGTAMLSLSVLSACGNDIRTEVSGRVGLSMSDEGDVIAHVQGCGLSYDEVSVAGPNINGRNKRYADLTHPAGPLGAFKVNLSKPSEDWVAESEPSLPTAPDELIIVNASMSDRDAQPVPVDAYLSEVQELEPGEILSGSTGGTHPETGRKVSSAEEFARCDN